MVNFADYSVGNDGAESAYHPKGIFAPSFGYVRCIGWPLEPEKDRASRTHFTFGPSLSGPLRGEP